MESPTATPDSSNQSPTASPERSLSRVLKSRRRKQLPDDGSSLSVDSNSLSVDRGGLLRSSIDRGIGKLSRLDRSRSTDTERRSSHDSGVGGRKFSKLLRSGSKRRRKKEQGQERGQANDEDDAAADAFDTYTIDDGNGSRESVGKSRSVASSLLTDDSDPEPLTRLPIASRDSHTGLLTLSSPLIASEAVRPSELGATKYYSDQSQSSLETDQSKQSDAGGLGISTAVELNGVSSQTSIPLQKSQTSPGITGSFQALFNTARKETGPTTSSSGGPIAARPIPHKITVTPPSSIDVPSTTVTPATPEQAPAPFPGTQNLKSSSGSSTPHITHRRVRSAAAGPTKLSAATIPLLTPAVEEISTPGGGVYQPGGSGSFFSSVFSATQNASNQLTNFFGQVGPIGSRSRSGTVPSQTERTGPTGGEEVIFPASTDSSAIAESAPKEPAVATLGSGSLSLSHLGISEPGATTSMTFQEEYADELTSSPKKLDGAGGTAPYREQNAAAEAVAAAYSDKPQRASSIYLEQANGIRPSSRGSGRGATEVTPPQSLSNGKEGSIVTRSGSVRSRLSDKRKRHRGSSGATGGAIAAALAASHGVLANPGANKARSTSLPMANPKRNRDFHSLFKSVPDDDVLIEDYSCALQREILLHGRIYISERHICFSSNIMGYVTTLVINFDEVMSLEKKNTAVIFPNAIVIQTLHAKNTFASLISREATYDLLLSIWKVKHSNIKATELGHNLESTVAAAKLDAVESEDASDDTEDDSGDEDEDEVGSFLDAEGGSLAGSDIGDRTVPNRSVSVATAATVVGGVSSKIPSTDAVAADTGTGDSPGPATHGPTDCTEADTHYEKLVLDDTIPAPLGKVYSMMFGPLSGTYLRKFLETQESNDIQYEDDKKGMDETAKTYSYSYIKKLTGSLGPKQTKCIVSQTLDVFDLERSVSVTCSTLTPDVPNGNMFTTKTRYCLMWGPGNSTRILMSSGVEWSGKSWLKGAIEKGAEGGQAQHGKDLAIFLRSQIAARSSVKIGKSGKKSKKKRSVGSPDPGASTQKLVSTAANTQKTSDWGPLEPLHTILSPVADILEPLASPVVMLSVLLLVVTVLWLRSPSRSASDKTTVPMPQRLAAYEELWRREESDLWSWLDDRLQLDDLYGAKVDMGAQQVLRGRAMEKSIEDEGMSLRQVDEAIRVTEEKLSALKKIVEKKRDVGKSGL